MSKRRQASKETGKTVMEGALVLLNTEKVGILHLRFYFSSVKESRGRIWEQDAPVESWGGDWQKQLSVAFTAYQSGFILKQEYVQNSAF